MVKMEIELTDEQFEKVKILESHGVDMGEAVDLLFSVQQEALFQLEEQKDDNNLIEKMTDTGFDLKIKSELLKKNFDESQTFDRKIQQAKSKIRWSEILTF